MAGFDFLFEGFTLLLGLPMAEALGGYAAMLKLVVKMRWPVIAAGSRCCGWGECSLRGFAGEVGGRRSWLYPSTILRMVPLGLRPLCESPI